MCEHMNMGRIHPLHSMACVAATSCSHWLEQQFNMPHSSQPVGLIDASVIENILMNQIHKLEVQYFVKFGQHEDVSGMT